MDKEQLFQVLFEQQKEFEEISNLIDRQAVNQVINLIKLNLPLIITGVRRCGKSSLLKLIKNKLKLNKNEFLYINFNDERFVNFDVENFKDTLDYLVENDYGKKCFLFIDEIQEVDNWEKWIDRIKEKFKIIITGSNSKLLSSEISTVLTGRSINFKLFPFSFLEFLSFKKLDLKNYRLDKKLQIKLKKLFKDYFKKGGFPKMIKENNNIILRELYQNILYRDILNRFNKNLIKQIKEISLYLQSNIATDLSLRTLSKISAIKNLSTLKEILDSFEQSFLFFSTSKFDYSVKKQIQNPKKIYCIDNGLSNTVGFRFSKNKGKLLENLIAIELLRKDLEIFYFRRKNECDFIIKKGLKVVQAIQICWKINDENQDREINGLLEAMQEFKLKESLILTFDQEDKFEIDGKKIIVKPVWKWLIEK